MVAVVSIIVPYFNSAEFLMRCISSILAQSFTDFELILVDDFSLDEGRHIVDAVAKDDCRIVSVSSVRKGANSARHSGFALAKGEYVMFVDSDDELEPDALKTLVDFAGRHSSDIVCGNIRLINGDLERELFNYEFAGLSVGLEEHANAICSLPPSACAKLFRRSTLVSVDFADAPFAQDWNITYSAIAAASSVGFVNNAVYRYIRRVGSTCSVHREMHLALIESTFVVWRSVLRAHSAAKTSHRVRAALFWIGTRFFFELLFRTCKIVPKPERRFAVASLCREWKATSEGMPLSAPPRQRDRILWAILSASASSFRVFELVRLLLLFRAFQKKIP